MPYTIYGAEGPVEIPDGEWYIDVMARCERLMTDAFLSADARRVYACITLASIAFKREEALILQDGRLRPMTSKDIRERTGMAKRSVLRAIGELETAGLIKRVPINGDSLQADNIRIFCWSTPRPAEKQRGGTRASPLADFLPAEWGVLKALSKRLKLTVTEETPVIDWEGDARVPLLAEAARVLADAEREAARLLKGLCACPPSNKEASNVLQDRKTGGEEAAAPPPPSPPAAHSHNGNGNGHAVAVVPAPDSATLERFERWRAHRSRCRKPVPDGPLARQCYDLFAAYPPPEQEQIIADTAARIPSYNKERVLKFIDAPLEYLTGKIWRTEPAQYIPANAAAEEDRMDFYRRAGERARERDRRDPRLS
jgi:hypothetical protein